MCDASRLVYFWRALHGPCSASARNAWFVTRSLPRDNQSDGVRFCFIPTTRDNYRHDTGKITYLLAGGEQASKVKAQDDLGAPVGGIHRPHLDSEIMR
jgi:hypothetical protein